MKKKLILLVAGMLVSMYSIQAQTYEWQQIGSDIEDEESNYTVSISTSLSSDGSIVAVGYPQPARVCVYKNNSGNWQQIGLDIIDTVLSYPHGHSVSLSSDGMIVAVGDAQGNGIDNHAGHVSIYRNNMGTWQQMGSDIVGESENDLLGWAVSLSSDGSVVAISAPNNGGNGYHSGLVRVYKYNSQTWQQIGHDILGKAAWDESGISLSLSSDGTVLAIGTPYNYQSIGQVRVFKNNYGSWQQVGSDIAGVVYMEYTGFSVSLSSDGSVLAIGATSSGIPSRTGQVRVFKNISGTWQPMGPDIDGESIGDQFGYSVSLSSDGSVLAIGAPVNDGSNIKQGHVRVYKYNSETWQQLGGIEDWAIGSSVSLSSDGSVVAVGALGRSGIVGQAIGGHISIYHYALGTGMNDLTHSGISISPNPTKDKIAITGNSDKTIENITITDITGKTVIKRSDIKQNGEIDLSGLGKGIYIIAFQTEKEIFTTKIIKE